MTQRLAAIRKMAGLAAFIAYLTESFDKLGEPRNGDFDAQIVDRAGGVGDIEPDQLRL
jgi:hypothetical protein